MQFYDMHTHILPEFDDGASSIEESLTLIDSLKKQNVHNICLTPHFYTNEMNAEDFVKERDEAYQKFLPHKPEDVNIILGAEVYVTKYLFVNDDLSKLTYGNSNYILTEFGYSSRFSDSTMEKIFTLINTHGLIPVIPHVERYETLMSDPEVIIELKNLGVVIQSNVGNYVKKAPFFRKKKLINYINRNLIDILGSDAHSLTHNTPDDYSQAIDFIKSKCGEDTVRRLMSNSEKIFNSAK